MTIIGTYYFPTRRHAERYYSGWRASELERKLKDGEIHIGKPPRKPGDKLILIDNGLRYANRGKNEMSKRQFCVIAETTPNRNWFDNEPAAISHAADLLRQKGQAATRLMVVEARVRVERDDPPIKVTALPDTTGDHIKPKRGQCSICGHYGSDCTGRD